MGDGLKKQLQKGDEFILKGPAKLKLIKGKAFFGTSSERELILKEGEGVVIGCVKDSLLEIHLGSGSEILEKKLSKEIKVPRMWYKFQDEISKAERGTVMVIGRTDSGKTTFTFFLTKKLLEKGKRVALIDSDVGQSDIGPPTTIGLAFADSDDMMEVLKPQRLYFTGTTSIKNITDHVCGLSILVEYARKRADFIIIDTCGYVSRDGGRNLKNSKLELIRPEFLVGLQKKMELEHLLKLYPQEKVLRVPISSNVKRISREMRRGLRQIRWRKSFDSFLERMYDLEELRLKNTYFRTGKRIETEIFSKLLRFECIYAEEIPEGYLLVRRDLKEEYPKEDVEFHGETLRILDYGWERNLVCGLERDGECLDIGIIKEINYENEMICISSKIMDFDTVKFGRIKVLENGEEIGFLRWA